MFLNESPRVRVVFRMEFEGQTYQIVRFDCIPLRLQHYKTINGRQRNAAALHRGVCMRQERHYCGKSKAGPFWRWRAGFLFQTNRFSRTLIADPRSVLSAIVRGCLINAFFVDGRFMNARPDPNPFALFRAHLDEPALAVIRAAVNRGQPVVGDHSKEQVAAALGRRALARKQGRQREDVAAQLPGQMGLDL